MKLPMFLLVKHLRAVAGRGETSSYDAKVMREAARMLEDGTVKTRLAVTSRQIHLNYAHLARDTKECDAWEDLREALENNPELIH